MTFKSVFFRHYDRKISDGTITFSSLGISKTDFTRLCTEDDFVFDLQTLSRVMSVMQLTDDEKKEMIEAAEKISD